MVEPKIILSLLVQGADLLTPEFCEKNPKESYNVEKMLVQYYKEDKETGKQKKVKEMLTIRTRKQKLITRNINICKEAYHHMLKTSTSDELEKPVKMDPQGKEVKRLWDTLSVHARLKKHFNQIAHDLGAVSYTYEILDD